MKFEWILVTIVVLIFIEMFYKPAEKYVVRDDYLLSNVTLEGPFLSSFQSSERSYKNYIRPYSSEQVKKYVDLLILYAKQYEQRYQNVFKNKNNMSAEDYKDTIDFINRDFNNNKAIPWNKLVDLLKVEDANYVILQKQEEEKRGKQIQKRL